MNCATIVFARRVSASELDEAIPNLACPTGLEIAILTLAKQAAYHTCHIYHTCHTYHTYNTYPRVPQYPPHLAYPLPSQLRGGFGVRGIRGVAHATSVSLLFCDDPHIVSKGVG